MDLKVYRKEKTYYGDILQTNIIDIYPVKQGNILSNAELVETDSNELEIQKCSLVSIWQYGNDLAEVEDGIRWAEALDGDISPLQLQSDLTNTIRQISSRSSISFDIENINGVSYLSYTLKVNE